MDSMFQECGYMKMESLTFGDWKRTSKCSLVTAENLFSECGFEKMSKLSFNAKNISGPTVKSMLYMFEWCGSKSLVELDLTDDFDPSGVDTFSSMFAFCGTHSMEKLNLGKNFDTSSGTRFPNVFKGTRCL